MEKDHYSKEFDDAPMPNSIFFTNRGHAIHGSFETRKLGRPASGGCVRLAPENAKVLFELVKAEGVLKTKVSVSGDERVAIARADRNLTRGDPRQAERGTGLPPTYSPREDDPRVRQQYAAQPQQPPQPQQYYYDGYQWRPYAAAQAIARRRSPITRSARRPITEQRGYAPQYYYQPRYGYGYD